LQSAPIGSVISAAFSTHVASRGVVRDRAERGELLQRELLKASGDRFESLA
jgi:hypothetical protein